MLKKLVFLTLSVFVSSLSFAQIEQIDSRAEMLKKVQDAREPAIVLDNTPYPFFSYEYYEDVLPFNLLNQQLYCVNEQRNKRNTDGGPAVIILTLSKDNIVRIEKLKNGTYYDVVEILSTEEQKNNLALTLKSTKTFIGDTVHYRMQDNKLREYKFSKKDVETLLNTLSLRDNNNVVYVLQDNSGKKYFLWHFRHTNASISNKQVYFVYGDYAKMQDFVSVNTFNHIKSIYEGKEIVSEPYYNNPFLSDKEECVYVVEKVVILDNSIALKVRNVKNRETKTVPVNSTYVRHLNDHKDSLLVLSALSGCALRTDADSLFTKWEYEKQQEEREKLAKDEKRKQELIIKYGQKYAQDIFDGKASVGMSKEMCKAALGSPDEVTKSSNSIGSMEIWVYSMYHKYYPSLYPIIVVTFTNDKVTSVNEYSDSNYVY